MARPSRNSPDAATGVGDIVITGAPSNRGGAGQSFRDTRARTFPILVTAHAGDNRYAFVRVDDTDPDAFPEIDGASDAGDGEGVAAFELNLRDDVPADGTVRATAWVLPEGRGVGFVYVPAIGGTGAAGCGCDWVAALQPNHCLRLTVLGAGARCGCGPAAGTVLDLKRSGAVWKPRSGGSLTICGATYTVEFSKEGCDGPCLRLVKVAGSSGGGSVAPSYQGVRGCCGPDYATFGFGDAALCTGTAVDDGRPSRNELRVKVEWVKCPANTVTVPCVCGVVSRCFTFTTSGSSCPQLNRTWHLTLDEEATNTPETGPSYFCTWKSEKVRMGPPQHPIANPEVTYENEFQWTMTVPGRSVGGVWLRGLFQAQLNPNAVDYRADFGVPWDCKSALALTKTDVNFGSIVTPEGNVDDIGVCPTMPTTVTIEPDADCGDDCVRPGWAGEGWYVVDDGAGGCAAAHLVESDKCDPSVIIQSGPYVSEADAASVCSGSGDPVAGYRCASGMCQGAVDVPGASGFYTTLIACQAACGGSGSDNPCPGVTYAQFYGGHSLAIGTTGGCSAFAGVYPVNHVAPTNSKIFKAGGIRDLAEVELIPDGGSWKMRVTCNGGVTNFSVSPASVVCDGPDGTTVVSFAGVSLSTCGSCSGTIHCTWTLKKV